MRIDPVLAALRHDPAPQRRAQAALEEARERWEKRPPVAAVLADVERFGSDGPFDGCPALQSLLSDRSRACAFVEPLIVHLAEALRSHPLGHVPLRHHYSPGLAVLQLASAGRAVLALVAYERRPEHTDIKTVCFSGGERRELCLAGAARARVFEIVDEDRHRAELARASRPIAPGDAIVWEGANRTRILSPTRGILVMLRLTRTDRDPAPAREYRIEDGALVHRAGGNSSESRDEMAAAVLHAMGRSDAAPVLAGIARSNASEHLRWQALCQAMALDTAAGFAELTTIACDAADALGPAAGALRTNLIERYPELASAGLPCPA